MAPSSESLVTLCAPIKHMLSCVDFEERRMSMSKTIADNLRALMSQKNYTDLKLAAETGIHPRQIKKYLAGTVKNPRPTQIARMAEALDVDPRAITFDPDIGVARFPKITENTKPIRIGDVRLDNQFLMMGVATETLDVAIEYLHQPLELDRYVRTAYPRMLAVAKANAEAKGTLFFDGPNTRLLRITQGGSRQMEDGSERRGIVLKMGPVSWYEFTVLNTFLDDDTGPDGRGWLKNTPKMTFRKKFAHTEKLFESQTDLRWCKLSNILTVNLTPITSDGYAVISRRSKEGVSVSGGLYSNGVAENIHRYLDEARYETPHIRENKIRTAREVAEKKTVPVDYEPEEGRAPSPLLTALRGVYEELSTDIYFHIKARSNCVRFLSVVMDLQLFNPHLIGIVDLGLTKAEVERMIETSPGKDHPEAMFFEFHKPTEANKDLMNLMRATEIWVPVGLASLIIAVKHCEATMRMTNSGIVWEPHQL